MCVRVRMCVCVCRNPQMSCPCCVNPHVWRHQTTNPSHQVRFSAAHLTSVTLLPHDLEIFTCQRPLCHVSYPEHCKIPCSLSVSPSRTCGSCQWCLPHCVPGSCEPRCAESLVCCFHPSHTIPVKNNCENAKTILSYLSLYFYPFDVETTPTLAK